MYRGTKQIFSNENTQTANRHMERCFISLNQHGSANQNQSEDHLTPLSLSIIKNATHNKCQQGQGEKGTIVHILVGYKWVQPPRKIVWRSLKNLKIELPYDPAIPLIDIYPKKRKTLIRNYIFSPMFIVTLFTIHDIYVCVCVYA